MFSVHATRKVMEHWMFLLSGISSGSMGSEAATVAANLQSFGGYLDAEGIDYHLIVVAKDMSSVRLCVKSPVATTKCNTEVAVQE